MIENFKVFLSILAEVFLATVLFFLIIFVAHWLKVFLDFLGEPEDSLIYGVGKAGEIVLLGADCLIGIFFASRGVYKAWQETWGKPATGKG